MKKNQLCTRKLRLRVFCLALAVLASLTIGRLSVAAQNQAPQDVNANAPVAVNSVDVLDAGVVCPFAVQLSQAGKTKQIDLPGDRVIFTFPGLDVTVTNLTSEPTKEVTLNITGVFHITTEQDGSVVTMVTGRNLLFDPQAGFVLAIGNFSFAFDAEGNLIQPLEGEGQLIDVCGAID